MPETAEAQNLHPENITFPYLPTCQKQLQLKTFISKRCLFKSSNMPKAATAQNLCPKTLPFQIFQHAKNMQELRTYISKHCLSKSSNMRKTAKPQNLHPKKLPVHQCFLDFSKVQKKKHFLQFLLTLKNQYNDLSSWPERLKSRPASISIPFEFFWQSFDCVLLSLIFQNGQTEIQQAH